MKKTVIISLIMLMLVMQAGLAAAASLTLELSARELQRGDELKLSGSFPGESEVVVKIVRPNQTVFYVDVLPVVNDRYAAVVRIPGSEELAPLGSYQVHAGGGQDLQYATFQVVSGSSGPGPSPDPGPSPNPNPGTGTPGTGLPGTGTIAPNAGSASGGAIKPQTDSTGGQLVGTDTMKQAIAQASGSVSIQLDRPEAVLQMPTEALKAAQDSGKSLVVEAGSLRVEFPAGAIPSPTAGQATIRFSLTAETTETAQSMLTRTLEQETQLIGTPVVLTLKLDWMNGNAATGISEFGVPVTVKLALTDEQAKSIRSELAGVYYINGEKAEYVGGSIKNGQLTFTVAHFSHYALLLLDKSFEDMRGHWAETHVKALAAKYITSGITDTQFGPGRSVTRAEFVSLLMRAYGYAGGETSSAVSGSFSDVTADRYYAKHVAEAAALGWVNGYNGKFRPDESITRQEATVVLMKLHAMMKLSASSAEPQRFADAADIASWAEPSVEAATGLGLIQGSGGRFHPLESMTRAEVAAVVNRLLAQI